MTNRTAKWLAFAAGAGAGALAGLLFAPHKGKKTRETLLKRARALRKELEHSMGREFTFLSKYKKSA